MVLASIINTLPLTGNLLSLSPGNYPCIEINKTVPDNIYMNSTCDKRLAGVLDNCMPYPHHPKLMRFDGDKANPNSAQILMEKRLSRLDDWLNEVTNKFPDPEAILSIDDLEYLTDVEMCLSLAEIIIIAEKYIGYDPLDCEAVTARHAIDSVAKIISELCTLNLHFVKKLRNIVLNKFKTHHRLIGIVRKRLRKRLSQAAANNSKKMPDVLSEFPPSIVSALLYNTIALELNQGCSIGCYFCALAADRKISNMFSFSDVSWLINHTVNPIFYYASDPLDYLWDARFREDIVAAFILQQAKAGRVVNNTSAIPRFFVPRLAELGDRLGRVSLSAMNLKYLMQAELVEKHSTKGGSDFYSFVPSSMLYGLTLAYLSDNLQKILEFLEMPSPVRLVEHQLRYALSFNHPIQKYEHQLQIKQKKMYSSGRHQSKTDRDGSIACKQGVIFNPNQIDNTFYLESSQLFETGEVRAQITVDNLKQGQQQLNRLKEKLLQGQTVLLDEIAPFGIVHKYDSADDVLNETDPEQKFINEHYLEPITSLLLPYVDGQIIQATMQVFDPSLEKYEKIYVLYNDKGVVLRIYNQSDIFSTQLMNLDRHTRSFIEQNAEPLMAIIKAKKIPVDTSSDISVVNAFLWAENYVYQLTDALNLESSWLLQLIIKHITTPIELNDGTKEDILTVLEKTADETYYSVTIDDYLIFRPFNDSYK